MPEGNMPELATRGDSTTQNMTPTGAVPESSRGRKRLTLACMCFALFMVMLDSTVVNLALKTIQLKMHASYSEVQWIVDAFVLALASLLLTGGTLGDLFGRRRAFISGLALFTGGSVLCALAPSTSFLIGSRVVQGIGGALMLPSTLSIITNTFRDPRERARAIGLWAGISGLALAVGPLIGGTLVDRFDWQSIFWINVPIGIVALVMAALFVPESSDRAGRSLDLPGQVTAVVGLVTLTYAFIEANTYGWTSARIVSCFIVSAVALGLFLVIELRSRSPLLQLKFFRNGTFSGANLVGVIVSFAFFGVIFFLSLFMQEVQGYSPTQAGALQLPATLGIMVAAILSGRIVGRIGARLPITIGLLMTGTALLCLTSVQQTTGYASFWYWLLLMGIGNGLIMSPMTTAIMGTVPAPRAGMASATSNTMRQVGSVFGIAVLGNLVTRPITDQTLTALSGLHLPPALVAGVMTAVREGRDLASGKVPPGVDGAALQHVVKSASAAGFTSGMHAALWVSGIMLLVGAPIALVTIRGTAPHHVAARDAAHAAASHGGQVGARAAAEDAVELVEVEP
jgi:EmrB/QacA subfamily drug resistance transporter